MKLHPPSPDDSTALTCSHVPPRPHRPTRAQVAPSYAPAGKTLVSVSTVGTLDELSDAALEAAVRAQLGAWFGAKETEEWSLLRVYRIPFAQPNQVRCCIIPLKRCSPRCCIASVTQLPIPFLSRFLARFREVALQWLSCPPPPGPPNELYPARVTGLRPVRVRRPSGQRNAGRSFQVRSEGGRSPYAGGFLGPLLAYIGH